MGKAREHTDGLLDTNPHGVREMQSIPGSSLGIYSHPLLCLQNSPSPTKPHPTPSPQPSLLGAEITPSPLVEMLAQVK